MAEKYELSKGWLLLMGPLIRCKTPSSASPDGTLDPLQDAFIEENAFQCGYCTPGMLMMTKKLMEEIPEPTEDEVRDYLKGNHCRCTGYASIVRAVQHASGREGS